LTDVPQNFTEMFKNLGEQLKIAPFDMTTIMEHQQKNLEAMTKSWQAMAGGANEIAKKQRAIFDEAVKDLTAMAQDYKPGGSPQDIVAKQAEFAKKAMEAAIANTRDIAELVQGGNTPRRDGSASWPAESKSDSLERFRRWRVSEYQPGPDSTWLPWPTWRGGTLAAS
jgi:phasin family protein